MPQTVVVDVEQSVLIRNVTVEKKGMKRVMKYVHTVNVKLVWK